MLPEPSETENTSESLASHEPISELWSPESVQQVSTPELQGSQIHETEASDSSYTGGLSAVSRLSELPH